MEDTEALVNNIYFERLFLRHPWFSKLLVLLRRELAEHEYWARKGNNRVLRALSSQCLAQLLQLEEVVRQDLGRKLRRDQFTDAFQETAVRLAKMIDGE